MHIKDDTITFSSGRSRHANLGIIGINKASAVVTAGYDSTFYAGDNSEDWRDEEDKLTKDDMIELSEHMIDLWTKYKDKLCTLHD